MKTIALWVAIVGAIAFLTGCNPESSMPSSSSTNMSTNMPPSTNTPAVPSAPADTNAPAK